MDITLPQDIEQELAKHAEQHGTTVEDLAVATLRREFPPKLPVEEPTEGTLYDFLREFVGIIDTSDIFPDGSRLSENTGRKFAELMFEKRAKGKL